MCPSIQLSPKNYARLQQHARPFDDTPDMVVGRVLDHYEQSDGAASAGNAAAEKARAQVGTLLPEKEYWIPILEALDERGGRAPAIEAIERVGELMRDRLGEAERGETSTGEIRWRNRTQFARLRMKQQGLIASGSPRGIWEMTDQGRDYLKQAA
ncbi:MAG TPA: winged helix-turn-helix domain-containing protein [Solirubrobacterales bacterium]|nr:winged helix-turn-helix domain-containing protein [Solirubrobacterales bacterium]